ncbi:hypothetical protein ACFWIW_27140, partial [Amycolatopsis sp. NPDC058340]|uniref:hypothetical protein n=1 Tax=Amycolatopsis sp. NPDC058340 TaxID=3346453 RepID=UPI0036580F7E
MALPGFTDGSSVVEQVSWWCREADYRRREPDPAPGRLLRWWWKQVSQVRLRYSWSWGGCLGYKEKKKKQPPVTPGKKKKKKEHPKK